MNRSLFVALIMLLLQLGFVGFVHAAEVPVEQPHKESLTSPLQGLIREEILSSLEETSRTLWHSYQELALELEHVFNRVYVQVSTSRQ